MTMATSSLGRLTLDLAVKLSNFVDGMTKAERETDVKTKKMRKSVSALKDGIMQDLGSTELGNALGSVSSRLGAIRGGGLVAGAALGGMAIGGAALATGYLAKLSIETAKADTQLAILANRTNTSLKNFQVLSHASAQLGTNQEQLARILADTQEKLGEFTATEGGGASDFFDALRNNTKMTDDQIRQFGRTLQGKDGVEAIQIVKDKLDAMGASAQEQRFVFESLGSDLADLMPLFAKGGDLLGRYGDALEEAGVIKTEEAIEQSRILAAQTQSVHTRFDGLKQQLAGKTIPVLNNLLNHFINGSTKSGEFGSVLESVGFIAKAVAAGIIGLATGIKLSLIYMQAFGAEINNIGQTAINFWNADGFFAKGQALATGAQNAFNIASDFAGDYVSELKNASQGMDDVFNSQATKLDKLGQLYYDSSDAIKQQTQGLRINTKEAERNAKAQEKATKAAGGGKSAVTGISQAKVFQLANGRWASNDPIMNRFIAIESMGNARANRKGSQYKGLMQLGAAERRKYGVTNGFNAHQNFAAAQKYALYHAEKLKERGIPTNATTLYLAHNQGLAGFTNIWKAAHGQAKLSKGSRRRMNSNGGKGKSAQEFLKYWQQRIEKDHQNFMSKFGAGKFLSESDVNKASNSYKRIYQESQRDLEQLQKQRESIKSRYATKAEKMESSHQQRLTEIRSAFADDADLRQYYIDKQKESYQEDLENFKWAQGAKQREQQKFYESLSGKISHSSLAASSDVLSSVYKRNMEPAQYEQWQLDSAKANANEGVYTDYKNRLAEINTQSEGDYVLPETQRNELIEQANLEHYNKLYQMELEFSEKQRQLDESKASQRQESYTQLFGGLTSTTAEFFGENSKMHRAAYAMEQAYAVHKALMNVEETYSNTYNSISAIPLVGPYIATPMAIAAAGMQVARAAKLKGMSPPTAIAHGGMDYVPKETTFLLDKGERVLSPRQNTDLTTFLANQTQNNVANVTIINNSSAKAIETKHPDGSVTIEMVDKMIGRAFSRLSQPNSHESKQIQRHTTARVARA